MQEAKEDAGSIYDKLIELSVGLLRLLKDDVNDECAEKFDHAYDVFALEVGALQELVEAGDPQVPREGQTKEGQRMYKAIVLIVFSYIPDQERIDATVHINKAPELVQHRLVKSDPKYYLLKHRLGRPCYHQYG